MNARLERKDRMKLLPQRLLWILALFPWFDFGIRVSLPSFIGSVWDDVFLLATLLVIWYIKRNQNEYRYTIIPNTIKWPFLIFLVFSLGSIVVNVVPLSVSFDVLRVVFEPMFYMLIGLYLFDDEKLRDRFINIMIVSTVLIAIIGIIQYVFQIESSRWHNSENSNQFRIISIFSNPNALGNYFNMILSFTIAFFLFTKEKKKKLLYLLVSLIIFMALLFTFSRGAWIAFFLMILFVVWVWNKKWLLILPVILAVVPFVMPNSVIERFSNLLDPSYYEMSSEYGRLSFWAGALDKLKDNPIFGVGLGMYGDSVPLRHNIPYSTWVDNHFIKLAAETGFFGALAFIVLMIALLMLTKKLYKQAKSNKDRAYLLGIGGVIITMSVQNFTASIFEALANAIFFYFFVGILFAYVWREREKGKCNE